MEFKCNSCGETYDESSLKWQCNCGGSLNCEFMPVFTKEDIVKERNSMWRYEGIYPLTYDDIKVSFNEGFTPLVKIKSEYCNICIKMDQLMPTGSFKDRGTVMVINYLKKHGIKKITEDSSGNAGASVAGYCALGNIPCEIYVPKGNSAGKLVQIKAYGADIYEVEGTRDEVALAAQEKGEFYAGHNWHPMFIQGTKSLAYELWEQSGFTVPDNIVSVAGNGSTILGIYYGFKELLNNKQLDHMPRIFAIQAENCNPIYRKYMGLEKIEKCKKTIAEGIALAKPNKVDQVINAIVETHGKIISVTEEEIKLGFKELSKKGIYTEPTSSTAYAGIKKLNENGILKKDDDVIMIVSGNGLKAGNLIQEILNED